MARAAHPRAIRMRPAQIRAPPPASTWETRLPSWAQCRRAGPDADRAAPNAPQAGSYWTITGSVELFT